MDFKKIEFGFTSSETERSENPDLLLKGYIDLNLSAEEAQSGRKFLFLGYKGSGKSGIGQRISLLAEQSYNRFVKVISLKDFPYSQLAKVVRGNAEPESKYPTAWSWLILPYLMGSLKDDLGQSLSSDSRFLNCIRAFEQMGLAPSSDPASIVRTSTKKAFSLVAPNNLGGASFEFGEKTAVSEIPDFVESAKNLLYEVRSDAKHILVIDGLDEILTVRKDQFRSLGALLSEVLSLNQAFRQNGAPFKIIILCRTDLYELIDAPNKNKIRQDYSIDIDWFHDPSHPAESMLVRAANARAQLASTNGIDIFENMMPKKIDGSDTRTYLLECTRHTPRDFLQLLKNVQEQQAGPIATVDSVKAGVRTYSQKYFLPEIKDEFVGYANASEIQTFFDLLGQLRKRDFSLTELMNFSTERKSTLSSEKILELMSILFACSAVGNVVTEGSRQFYTFKYRNRHSMLNHADRLMLHRGLWKALNVS